MPEPEGPHTKTYQAAELGQGLTVLGGQVYTGDIVLTAGGTMHDTVEVAPQVVAPVEIQVVVIGLDFMVELMLDSVPHNGYRVTKVVVHSKDEHEVTGEMLRGLPIQRWARTGFKQCLMFRENEASGAAASGSYSYGGPFPEWVKKEWPSGNVDLVLRYSTWAYQTASAVNEPPTKAVQNGMGVSRATASRIVAMAREKGILAGRQEVPDGA